MGDRGNIVVRSEDGDIWLYTHWGGSDLWEDLQKALGKRERWTDPSYLTRIIFCVMVKGNEDETTGFGISTRCGDNEHDILVVDTKQQRVEVYPFSNEELRGEPALSYTFEEFLAAKPPEE